MRKSQYIRVVARKTFRRRITRQDLLHIQHLNLKLLLRQHIYLAEMELMQGQWVQAAIQFTMIGLLQQQLALLPKEC